MVVLPLKTLPLPPTPILKSKPGFHKAVRQLLAKTDKPCKPVNYRGKPHIRSSKHVLLHEEEQHLADHLAFLAQTSPDPFCVSAIMIEESSTPPSLHIRLAANKTPTAKSVSGLKNCLKTVEKFAKTGIDRDEYETTLLNQVIELSEFRLHSRINSRQAREGRWSRRKFNKPLHTRIQILLDSLNNQPSPLKDSIRPLARKLPDLIQALNNIDENIDSNQIDQLRKVILSSHEISSFNGSPSLEHYLNSLACGMEISQHGTVLTIDKISQYLDVCTYLLHLCRKPKYRPIFSNITLEPLISPPASHPDGAVARHYVHGEVQLILYHEQNPRNPAPRCIGSSKSACFLCDSFIRKHGKFHISHSHKRLYEQWTVPEEPWMTSSCGKKLDNILNDMSCEILDLAETWKRPAKCENDGAESRVHLLMLPKSAKSSGMSLPKISEAASHHSSTENIASFESGTKEDRPKNRKYTLELDDASTTSFDIDEAINPDTIRFSNGLTNYVERSSIKSFIESFLKSSKSALYLPLPTKIEKVEYMVNKTPSNQAQISLIDNTIDLLANNSGINLPRASKSSFRLPLGDGAPIESKAQVSESKHFPVNQMAGQTEALPKVSSEISVPNSSKSSLHLPISNKQATKVEVEPKETESKFPDISDSVLSQSETSSSIKLTRSKTMPKYSPVIPKTQSELSISLKSPFPQPNPTYTLNDLPLNLPIPPHHPKDSIILHLNNVEYIFDILAMKSGHLIIERHEPHEPEAGNELLEERQPYEKKTKKPQSINVRGPELDTEVVISGAESDVNANAIAFSVNDGGDFGICVKIIWEDSGE